VSRPPAFDERTIDGLITALKSPAVNVRAIGFEGLKAKGASAVDAVAKLLDDDNPYIRGRALFLLYQLGPEGAARAGAPDSQRDPERKIAAYRAMRRGGLEFLPAAARLARDADAGVRREVALSLRDVPAEQSIPILIELARSYDGPDRSYLEAWGTGATGKEALLYDPLRNALAPGADPLRWSATFAQLAWRLHVPAALPDLRARARSKALPMAERRLAMDTIAFIDDKAASRAMLALAAPGSGLEEPATWWLLNRMSNSWSGHDLQRELKATRIYDPDAIRVRPMTVPRPEVSGPSLVAEAIAGMAGDAARGKQVLTRCLMCHAHGGVGAELGPALDGWGRGKSAAVIATALVTPDADIAHGYEGTELKTTDGLTLQGVLIKQGDPLMMRGMGNVTQLIPANRVAEQRRMKESLMMSAAQLGLDAQDVADLVAFLRVN
jgi:putative heme-binding domain-containing protein